MEKPLGLNLSLSLSLGLQQQPISSSSPSPLPFPSPAWAGPPATCPAAPCPSLLLSPSLTPGTHLSASSSTLWLAAVRGATARQRPTGSTRVPAEVNGDLTRPRDPTAHSLLRILIIFHLYSNICSAKHVFSNTSGTMLIVKAYVLKDYLFLPF